MLKTYQQTQAERLAMPKRGSVADLENLAMFERAATDTKGIVAGGGSATLESPRGSRSFLRKTTE